jgi:hypothetical protein
LEQAEIERPQREADMAERAARRQHEWRPPEREPEPTPQRAEASHTDRRERRKLAQFITLTIQREIAAALRRERAELADHIGKALAAERRQFRAINDGLLDRLAKLEAAQRGASDSNSNAPVLFDLSDERRRRSGQ